MKLMVYQWKGAFLTNNCGCWNTDHNLSIMIRSVSCTEHCTFGVVLKILNWKRKKKRTATCVICIKSRYILWRINTIFMKIINTIYCKYQYSQLEKKRSLHTFIDGTSHIKLERSLSKIREMDRIDYKLMSLQSNWSPF